MDKAYLTSDKSRTTKLGVRLIGLPSDSNKQTLEEWVRKLLQDNDLLQHRNGNPVTYTQFIGSDVYVEFRCEEEHRRFLRLRQEHFHDRCWIRICNWLDSAEALPNIDKSEDRARKRHHFPSDGSIHSKRRRTVERTQSVLDPIREQCESRIRLNLTIRLYCPVPKQTEKTILSMISDLTIIMREEGFLQQNEDAVSRYWFTLGRPIALLEAMSEELASKMCLCNGRRSATDGILYRVARERHQQQDPIDWFSYYQSRYGRPWEEGLDKLRVTFLNSATLEMAELFGCRFTADVNEKRDVLLLLCREAKAKWKQGGGRNLNRKILNALEMVHPSRVGYHFLLEATSSDSTSAFASLDGMPVEQGKLILRIRRCCDPCESVQVSATSMQLVATAPDCGKGKSTQGSNAIDIMRNDCSIRWGSQVPEEQGTKSVIPPSYVKNDADSCLAETEEEGSVAEISVNDRQQDSAKDKEIALLREQLEKVTSELEESKMQTSAIHDDWKTMKSQEKEQEDKLKTKEAQFAQLSESLSLLTRQQLKDRQEIQELTDKLRETNGKLRSSSLSIKS